MRELIRASFLGPGISPDPAGDGSGWERGQNIVPEDKLVAAAVLVPLIERPEGMTVLLTRRTDAIRHAGQVCFPGGRSHGRHETPEETALREAEEEIGLARDRVELVGRLNVRHTGTGYKVTPVVGLVAPPVTLRPDPSEVAHIFEVPLADVLDTANHRLEVQLRDGREREFYVLSHPEHYIWGLTARFLVNLQQVLAEAFARR
jgi:8-oxo-dGTP pyrophosphatase MutT (NUDIX family)